MADESFWSVWLPLDRITVQDSVPLAPGVYQVRPVGASSAAYIGSATGKGGLRQRIGQRVSDPLRYLSVFEKQLVLIGLTLEFRCARAATPELAKAWESRLLSEYKLSHGGKLPPGNKVTPRKYSG